MSGRPALLLLLMALLRRAWLLRPGVCCGRALALRLLLRPRGRLRARRLAAAAAADTSCCRAGLTCCWPAWCCTLPSALIPLLLLLLPRLCYAALVAPRTSSSTTILPLLILI